jgi:hypothetical protein
VLLELRERIQAAPVLVPPPINSFSISLIRSSPRCYRPRSHHNRFLSIEDSTSSRVSQIIRPNQASGMPKEASNKVFDGLEAANVVHVWSCRGV